MLLIYLGRQDDLDEGVVTVLEASIKRYMRVLLTTKGTLRGPDQMAELKFKLRNNRKIEPELLSKYGLGSQTDG